MKPETSLKKRVLNLILGAALLLTASCDYFDITGDKDGNKITLISIDLPEFDASYSIRVRELWLNTNPSRPVYVELSGQSVEDDKIITDLGYLKRSFVLDQEKRLFLYLNPNFKVTEQDPVEFTLSGMNSDCLILPYRVKQSQSGESELELHVVNTARLSLPDAEENTPTVLFRSGSDRTVRPIGKLTGPDGRGYEYDALYKAAESGVYQIAMNDEFEEVLLVNLNNGKTKEPATSIEVAKGEYFASLVRRKGMIESSLIFDVTGDPSTTVSLSYVIQTHTRRISGQLSGIVPFRRNIESILVPEEDPSAQITFRAVSPLSITDSVRIIRDITLQTDPVSVRIERNEQSDHRFYEMYVLAFCPTRKNISVALTKGFEIWEGGPDDYDRSSVLSSMLIQGRTGIYLRPDTRHTLRFYFDNVKYEYEMTTDASMAHEYLGESLLTLKITEKDHLRTDLYMEISNTLMCDFIP